jgi:hypothetical protein
VQGVRALLRGQTAGWDGGRIRMLHPAGFGPARPVDVPFLLAAAGPKGIAGRSSLPPASKARAKVCTPPQFRQRLAALEAGGVTDIAFQPAGDICAELEAFAAAARC